MKLALLIIISLLNLLDSSLYSINIHTSLGLRLLKLATKGDILTSQMCRPCRTLGKLSSFYIRRLHFASPTINKVLSLYLRDLSLHKEYSKNLTALPFAGFSWLFKEKFLIFLAQAENTPPAVSLQSGCSVTTVRLQ
jgi:hypothetical protein